MVNERKALARIASWTATRRQKKKILLISDATKDRVAIRRKISTKVDRDFLADKITAKKHDGSFNIVGQNFQQKVLHRQHRVQHQNQQQQHHQQQQQQKRHERQRRQQNCQQEIEQQIEGIPLKFVRYNIILDIHF